MLASAEYGCAVAEAKLIIVIGHTRCGAVSAAVKLRGAHLAAADATGCQHLDSIVNEIQRSAESVFRHTTEPISPDMGSIVDAVARENVLHVVKEIRARSRTLDNLVRERCLAIVGAMYDVTTGDVEFLIEDGSGKEALQKTA